MPFMWKDNMKTNYYLIRIGSFLLFLACIFFFMRKDFTGAFIMCIGVGLVFAWSWRITKL